MPSRIDLQKKLESLLGSRNVYYQSPETIKMEYPAIRYSKTDIETKFANDKRYMHKNRYEIIVIDRRPDNLVIDKILEMPMSSYDRHYVADNLNHDVITLYY